MEKRKAATSVFMEQQQALPAEEVNAVAGAGMDVMNELPQVAQKVEAPAPPRVRRSFGVSLSTLKTSEEMQLEKDPVRVRETGFGLWRRVIVPPNAYVVHTRINRSEPVSLGMGISFRYRRNKDAYQVVPGAVQTIGVVANCITREKQGINVLAYLQWQIEDFAVAYRKLDVSDTRDPLGIVNAQLREQAEAAIKDKIATMSVEEVLTDKAPIIAELTTRLKQVTEGQHQGAGGGDGLGIKVITVQIREALVCSQTLWANLQAPFRNEKEQQARISALTMQDEIRRKELEARKNSETEQATTEADIERIRELKQTEALELKLKEESTRFAREQEAARAKLAMEEQTAMAQKEAQQRIEAKERELELARELDALRIANERVAEEGRLGLEQHRRAKAIEADQSIAETEERQRAEARAREYEVQKLVAEANLKRQEARFRLEVQQHEDGLAKAVLAAKLERATAEHEFQMKLEADRQRAESEKQEAAVRVEKLRQEVRNIISGSDLTSRLIAELPGIAESLPEVKEMRVIQTGGDNQLIDALAGFVTKVMTLAQGLGIELPRPAGAAKE